MKSQSPYTDTREGVTQSDTFIDTYFPQHLTYGETNEQFAHTFMKFPSAPINSSDLSHEPICSAR